MRSFTRPIGLSLLGLTAITASLVPSHQPSEVARVIIAAATSVEAVVADVQAVGGTVEQTHNALGMVTATVDAHGQALLSRDSDVSSVTVDSTVAMSSTAYQPQAGGSTTGVMADVLGLTGAKNFHKANYTGDGIDIALIDTGISPVPGLDQTGKIVHVVDLSADQVEGETEFVDEYGHGTHLAGIIAGMPDNGAQSIGNGSSQLDPFVGIAPGARLINVKAGDKNGGAHVSQIIEALDLIVQNKNADGLNIRVVNIAFGTDADQAAASDPLVQAVEQAWDAGIVVVASAGNRASSLGRLDSPARSSKIIAVGAADYANPGNTSDDTIASFSSVGDGVRDPDFVAPGVSVMSLRQPGGYIDVNYPQARRGDHLLSGGGTSQAAAVVSGLVALVLDANPDWTPDQVKLAMISNATDLVDGTAFDGAGMVSLKKITLPANTDGSAPSTESDASTASNDGTWNGSTWNGSTWNGSTWNGSTWNGYWGE